MGGCGGMVTLGVVWRVCRPAELLLLSQIPCLRSSCGWRQEAKISLVEWVPVGVTTALPIPKLTVNHLFKSYLVSKTCGRPCLAGLGHNMRSK